MTRHLVKATSIDKIESIISIENGCRKPDDKIYCYHIVHYTYNGVEQNEEFSSHDILRICKHLNCSVSSHFSEESWAKEYFTHRNNNNNNIEKTI